MEYIATFFSHFGATRFAKNLKAQQIEAKTTPVPRRVSASCGSCVRFQAEDFSPFLSEDVEAIFADDAGELKKVYSNF